MYLRRQKVGGLTFLRLHAFGRTFIFTFCESRKHHVMGA